VTTSEKRLFINRHSLTEVYLKQASIWFDPIIENLIKHHNRAKTPLIVGINGCQGSGKTTLADYFSTSFKAHGLRSVAMSLDDFYLTSEQRQSLASNTHPLLATRGVPGTHDIPLALATINALKHNNGVVSTPRFNKAVDDRVPQERWTRIDTPVDVIILEGWCIGIEGQIEQDLMQPINQLEALHDADGKWRHYVNQQITNNYTELWKLIDSLIMLKAPSFNCVFHWRLEQEEKLYLRHEKDEQAASNKIMSPFEVKNFVQYYERLTRHTLAHLPKRCQHVFELSNQREIINHHQPKPLSFDTSLGSNHELSSGDIL
jgi:D-glycerate 3-kinase